MLNGRAELSESAGRPAPGRTWADQVAARRPHGVVLVLSGLDESQLALPTSRSIPFVVMDPAGDPGPDMPSIGATNRQGGLAATRHPVELGHTGSARSAARPRRCAAGPAPAATVPPWRRSMPPATGRCRTAVR
ncbi:hypothetical protein BFF78_17240 [Streptomyces fodineus]|uniref:Periplasmic binding protein/LacI sugar binding domain-containing protein n=1 Tax=Streptomyces fodineus TaxID=1904616 RepID=A0A1D7YAB8_9ACTN|nr:hypothetical protein BFF78_17240 [Streptomyces fodineus]